MFLQLHLQFSPSGKSSLFQLPANGKRGLGSVKDGTVSLGLLGFPSGFKWQTHFLCIEPLHLRTPLESTGWAGAMFAWELLPLYGLVQTSNSLLVLGTPSMIMVLFSCSYLCSHLFLDLIEASSLRGPLFQLCKPKIKCTGLGSYWPCLPCPLFQAFGIIQGDYFLHFSALRNVHFLKDCLGFKESL